MENQHFTHKYALAINSIACIILSGFMTTILHELAHFIPAYFYGLNPELHHNFVWYKDEPTQLYQAVIIPAAGPIFSLILGLICLYFSKKIVEKGVLSLFLLWMGLQGYVTFFGYLLIAPFFTYGDTGRVFALLNLPQMLVIALSIAAIIALTLLVKKEFKEFGYYGNPDYTIKERANALILFPVLGSIASAVLQLPVPTVLSIRRRMNQ